MSRRCVKSGWMGSGVTLSPGSFSSLVAKRQPGRWSDGFYEGLQEMRKVTFLLHVPVDGSIRDDVLKTLELSNDQSTVGCFVSACHPPQNFEMAVTDPRGRHRRRKDGTGPSLVGTRRRASWKQNCERLIARV